MPSAICVFQYCTSFRIFWILHVLICQCLLGNSLGSVCVVVNWIFTIIYWVKNYHPVLKISKSRLSLSEFIDIVRGLNTGLALLCFVCRCDYSTNMKYTYLGHNGSHEILLVQWTICIHYDIFHAQLTFLWPINIESMARNWIILGRRTFSEYILCSSCLIHPSHWKPCI